VLSYHFKPNACVSKCDAMDDKITAHLSICNLLFFIFFSRQVNFFFCASTSVSCGRLTFLFFIPDETYFFLFFRLSAFFVYSSIGIRQSYFFILFACIYIQGHIPIFSFLRNLLFFSSCESPTLLFFLVARSGRKPTYFFCSKKKMSPKKPWR